MDRLPPLEDIHIIIGPTGPEREEQLLQLRDKAAGYAVMWVKIEPGMEISDAMHSASMNMEDQFHPQHWERITSAMERYRRVYWNLAPRWRDLDDEEYCAPFLLADAGSVNETIEQWALLSTLIRGTKGWGGLCICFDGLDLLSREELEYLDSSYEHMLRYATDAPLLLLGTATDIPYPLGARAERHYMKGAKSKTYIPPSFEELMNRPPIPDDWQQPATEIPYRLTSQQLHEDQHLPPWSKNRTKKPDTPT